MNINPFNRKSKPEAVATTAVRKTADGAHSAVDRTAEAVEQAIELLVPMLVGAQKTAKERTADLTKNVQPKLHDVAGLVAPHVDTAKSKVQEDLVPKLVALMEQAQEHPAVHEAQKRSVATMAALKGDLVVPEPKQKRSVGGTVAKVAAASAVLAAVAVAVRQFLSGRDADWTAHEPSTGYKAPTLADETITETTEQVVAEQTWDDEAPLADVTSDNLGDAAMDAAEMGDVAEAAPRTYGEGAHVGDNPPEGYTIKGNERSMKFHTTDSAGYERTIADVWFNSEQAAEEAGFTRAQR